MSTAGRRRRLTQLITLGRDLESMDRERARLGVELEAMNRALDEWARRMGLDYADLRRLYLELNETTRSVAAARDVPLVDLEREIPGTREFVYDEVHLTSAGARRAAGRIEQVLEPLLGDDPRPPA